MANKNEVRIENQIKVIAGTLIFVSAFLGFFFSKNWLFFTMFVGLNLFQFGFTGFCPMKILLEKKSNS